MAPSTTSLRYDGGGSLTFRDESGHRRTVTHTATFEVDQTTAEILMRDPSVVPADEAPSGSPQTPTRPAIDLATATKSELLEHAARLGLDVSRRMNVDDIRSAIADRDPADAPLVDETTPLVSSSDEGDTGGTPPADEPAVTAAGEAGAPPEQKSEPGAPAEAGAITLGDLPRGGVRGGKK